jgi:hypothetical protein
VGFLIDLKANIIELADRDSVENVSEVVDIISGLQLRNGFRAEGGDQSQHN